MWRGLWDLWQTKAPVGTNTIQYQHWTNVIWSNDCNFKCLSDSGWKDKELKRSESKSGELSSPGGGCGRFGTQHADAPRCFESKWFLSIEQNGLPSFERFHLSFPSSLSSFSPRCWKAEYSLHFLQWQHMTGKNPNMAPQASCASEPQSLLIMLIWGEAKRSIWKYSIANACKCTL